MIFQAILLVIFVYLPLFLLFKKAKYRHPPGPTGGIPLIGYFPSYLGLKPYELLDRWAKKYGPIFTLKIGGRSYYVLNSYDMIRSAYVHDGNGNNFLDRPQDFNLLGSLFEFKALAFTNGPEWALQRKLLSSLIRRNLVAVEASIIQSGQEIVQRIQKLPVGPVDLYPILTEAVLNVISTLVCDERLGETNPEVAIQIIRDTHLAFSNTPGGDGFLAGFIVKILENRFTKKPQTLEQIRRRQYKLMGQFVAAHEADFDPSNIRDYIDTCLNEKSKSRTETEQKWLDTTNLVANMLMFFIAGVDTSASTLYFAIFLLAKYPQVQEQCLEELTSTLGNGTGVTMKDKPRLPYLCSVVNEINRYSVVGPLPQPRQNLNKTNLGGYDIPAGSHFITNLWTATRDSTYFANPHEFDPNHYYLKDLPRDLASLSFSSGKRACPGENLAAMELFLLIATLIQHFRISESPGQELKENIVPGFARLLAPFQVIVSER